MKQVIGGGGGAVSPEVRVWTWAGTQQTAKQVALGIIQHLGYFGLFCKFIMDIVIFPTVGIEAIGRADAGFLKGGNPTIMCHRHSPIGCVWWTTVAPPIRAVLYCGHLLGRPTLTHYSDTSKISNYLSSMPRK